MGVTLLLYSLPLCHYNTAIDRNKYLRRAEMPDNVQGKQSEVGRDEVEEEEEQTAYYQKQKKLKLRKMIRALTHLCEVHAGNGAEWISVCVCDKIE